jgi:6-phosphogluconolactonase (cycloisomerase 2 family)
MKTNHLLNAILASLALLAAGCSSVTYYYKIPTQGCVPSSTQEYAYALTGYSVSMYAVEPCSGNFNPTHPATIAAGGVSPDNPAEQMVADPGGRFAYVANLISNASDLATISMYTIDSKTGVLTATTPATVPTGFFPQGIAIDPAGKFVYTANSDDNTVSMFTINQTTGVLSPTTPAVVSIGAGTSPISVTVDPTGKFAYVANQDNNTISMFTINSTTGVLTATTPATVATGFSPFGIAVSPNGKFAYVPNSGSGGTITNGVSQYTINSTTGVLTPNTPAAVAAGNEPTAVAVDPTNKFAYVVNRLDNTVSMYTINPTTGNLILNSTTKNPNGTISTGTQPYRIGFDPSGLFLYVTNEQSAASIYTVNNDGTLSHAWETGPATGALSIAITAVK